MSIQNVTARDLKRASKIKEQIEKLEGELRSILTKVGAPAAATSSAPRKKRRKMSKAAKAKISAAQKQRWQKRKKADKK